MKKAVIISTIMCIFIFDIFSQTKAEMTKPDNFEISVTSKYFGRKDKMISINTDRIIYEKNIAVGKQNYSKGETEITEELKREIISFLTLNPVESFKTSYSNSGVKDGTVLSFTFKVNDTEKNIFVANYYIKELGELVKIINQSIPEEYFISYGQDCCTEINK